MIGIKKVFQSSKGAWVSGGVGVLIAMLTVIALVANEVSLLPIALIVSSVLLLSYAALAISLKMKRIFNKILTKTNGLHSYSREERQLLTSNANALSRLEAHINSIEDLVRYSSLQIESLDSKSKSIPVEGSPAAVEDHDFDSDGEDPSTRLTLEWLQISDLEDELEAREHAAGFVPAADEISRLFGKGESGDRFIHQSTVVRWNPKPSQIDGETGQIHLEHDAPGVEVEFATEEGQLLDIALPIIPPKDGSGSPKAALAWAVAVDVDGSIMDSQLLPSVNEKYGSYSYLDSRNFTRKKLSIEVPTGAKSIKLGIAPWEQGISVAPSFEVVRTMLNPAWLENRSLSDIRVAVILDEFSYKSFEPEFDAVVLTPENWRDELTSKRPDLFLCESAWSGVDSSRRDWKGQIYSSTNFSAENRTALLGILEYCKRNSIPTVFWNKEDPTHFDDAVHNFVDTAIRFDHIFTTDSDCVSKYREKYGHKSVHSLPFAVQPRLFNPIPHQSRSQDLVFAGGWYGNHLERCDDMHRIFESALSSGRELKIYDRFYGTDDELHMFPEAYAMYTLPPVPYDEMPSVYKESELGLTINTVTDSCTMFARRIFELMACNTYVVSNYSRGVEELFGNNVTFADVNPRELTELSDREIDSRRRRNLELVLREHTYRQRFKKIVDVVGLKYKPDQSDYTIISRVCTESECLAAISAFEEYAPRPSRLLLLVGDEVAGTTSARIFQNFNKNNVLVLDSRLLADGRISFESVVSEDDDVLYCPSLDSAPESLSQIEWFSLHRQYHRGPISKSSGEQFSFQNWDGASPVLIASGMFLSTLKLLKQNRLTVYGV